MKPIKIKNEEGENIEITFNEDGVIKIRHSDIDAETWGELKEFSKVMRHPGFQAFIAKQGINDLDSPAAKELSEKLGGYIVMPNGESMMISREEVTAIHEAVKQAGGIVPNWSSTRI